MAEFYVEQQYWKHWPKVLVMCRKNGRDVTHRRYVPEAETGEGMSITDELREFASHCAGGMGGDALRAIADRIDAAHENSVVDALLNDGLPMSDEVMAEHGWTRLPVDADGEYIHIGDRMENNERVARIVITDESWEPSVYLEKLPNVLHEYFCSEISHYHAPTVEDVLREFANRWWTLPREESADELLADYAKRLQLREDA